MSDSLENRGVVAAKLVSLRKTIPTYIPSNAPDGCGCEPYLVCGKDGGETWQKDYTSAWVKLYLATDTATFTLKDKDGVDTTYQPTEVIFRNDNGFSKYVTIDWTEVLIQDGTGCYTLNVDYSIAGVSDSFEWGEYNLFEFTTDIVDKTVRIKSIFNSNQSIQELNFTDENVVDTFRFGGYFGDMQPKMEIDNIIYNSRETKKVVRENLKEYTLFTNQLSNENISYLVDLHLLSENEVYISDFNALNVTYSYLDYALIVSESPELEYIDRNRKLKLQCKFADKFKNQRSYY